MSCTTCFSTPRPLSKVRKERKKQNARDVCATPDSPQTCNMAALRAGKHMEVEHCSHAALYPSGYSAAGSA